MPCCRTSSRARADVAAMRSEMMTADELTKDVSEEAHQYAKLVWQSGLWTLSEDSRAPPPRRGRLLEEKGQLETATAEVHKSFIADRQTRP